MLAPSGACSAHTRLLCVRANYDVPPTPLAYSVVEELRLCLPLGAVTPPASLRRPPHLLRKCTIESAFDASTKCSARAYLVRVSYFLLREGFSGFIIVVRADAS